VEAAETRAEAEAVAVEEEAAEAGGTGSGGTHPRMRRMGLVMHLAFSVRYHGHGQAYDTSKVDE